LGRFACGLSIDAETKTRDYAASAYYTPDVAKIPDLEVLTEVLVEKILTKNIGDSVEATGVKVRTKDGAIHEIVAMKEVILSAGAMHSPLILELSGIGKKGPSSEAWHSSSPRYARRR